MTEWELALARQAQLANIAPSILVTRVIMLEAAIRRHRDERGHDRCWLDDLRLYAVLPEGTGQEAWERDFQLPPREEFLRECERYHQNRQPPSEPH